MIDLMASVDGVQSLPSFGDSIVRMVVVLGMLLGALVIALWLVKRLLRTRLPEGTTIDVEGSRQLEPGKRLYIVRVEGQRLLVGCGPGGFDALAVLGPKASFSETLHRGSKSSSSIDATPDAT